MSQTIQKEFNTRDTEWNAGQQKAVSLSFLAIGLSTAFILGFGTLLGS